MKRSTCPSCGKRVLAAPLLLSAKTLLLEPEPSLEGEVVLVGVQAAESQIAVGPKFPRFLSHQEKRRLALMLPETRPHRWAVHKDRCAGRKKSA